MRPIFEYDHVRGCLLVRLDVTDECPPHPHGWLYFRTRDRSRPVMEVEPGMEPPLYCAPIHDVALLTMVGYVSAPFEPT